MATQFHWGGSQELLEPTVPTAIKHGGWPSSRKRAANHPLSISNPGSDHNTRNKLSYAIDFATFKGAPVARAVGRQLGIRHVVIGSYQRYTVHQFGATYSVQLLWAVQGHYDHEHTGARLIAGTPRSPKPKYPVYWSSATAWEKTVINKLLFHRRGAIKERESGEGPKYKKHVRWKDSYYERLSKHAHQLRVDAESDTRKGKKGWAIDNRGKRYQLCLVALRDRNGVIV